MKTVRALGAVMALGLLFAALSAEPSWAQGFDKVTTILEKVAAAFSSGFVKAIATLAIIGFGISMLIGQLDVKRGLMIIVACGIILGASAIAGMLVA